MAVFFVLGAGAALALSIPMAHAEDGRLARFRVFYPVEDALGSSIVAGTFGSAEPLPWLSNTGWVYTLATVVDGVHVILDLSGAMFGIQHVEATSGISYSSPDSFRFDTRGYVPAADRKRILVEAYWWHDGGPWIIDFDEHPVRSESLESILRESKDPHSDFQWMHPAWGPDDILFMLGYRVYDDAAPLVLLALDPREERVVQRTVLPSHVRGGKLHYWRSAGELLLFGWPTFTRIEPSTGEVIGQYENPGSRIGINSDKMLIAGDRIVVHRDDWIATFDPADGSLLSEVSTGLEMSELRFADTSGIAFAFVGNGHPDRRWPEIEEIVALDTATGEVLGTYRLASNIHRVASRIAIAAVEPDWTPAPTPTPTSTPSPSPTPSPTPPPWWTPIPTRPPCVPLAVTFDSTSAHPGETIDVKIRLTARDGCMQAIAGRLRGDRDLSMGAQGKPPCTMDPPQNVRNFSSHAVDCDSVDGVCTTATFTWFRPYDDSGFVAFDGDDLLVTCRVAVEREAPVGEVALHVELFEHSHTDRTVRRFDAAIAVVGMPITMTPSPTPTATPEPTVSACAGECPVVRVRPVQVRRGGIAVVEARLESAGHGIVAVQSDIQLPSGMAAGSSSSATWRCRGNPFLPQHAAFREHDCDGASCRTIRALVYGLEAPLPPIPDGAMLYTCRVSVAADAPLGDSEILLSGTIASDAVGKRVVTDAPPAPISVRDVDP